MPWAEEEDTVKGSVLARAGENAGADPMSGEAGVVCESRESALPEVKESSGQKNNHPSQTGQDFMPAEPPVTWNWAWGWK